MEHLLGERRNHIVVVDDNPVNLDLAEAILKDHYKVTKLISGEQLLKFLTRIHPDMILLDILMPGMDGFETLSEIRKEPILCSIPVIFVSGQKDSVSETKAFLLGAQDFIGKPFNNEVTLSRIRAQLELYQYRSDLEGIITEKTRRIDDLQHVITVSWAEMVESRDGTTGEHVRFTSLYYEVLLKAMAKKPDFSSQLTEELIMDYVRASIIHDIGKIGISDLILKKPAQLTKEEFETMKQHSAIGADMIQKIMKESNMEGFLLYARELALNHHERFDGTGYPNGIGGDQLSIFAMALSIADVYDALTSVRPYKKAFSHEKALDIMNADCGVFYSPDIFRIFLDCQEDFNRIRSTRMETIS